MTLCGVLLCLCVIGGQLVRLALRSGPEIKVALAEPLARSWSRPDIVDRNGRLLASDIAVNSLYADPQLILDLDEVIEKLAATLPGLDEAELRKSLADRSRRFAWVARGLSPRQAQSVHDLGLPGLAFRVELKRAYPLSALAGHLLGTVNTDNKGLAGIERLLDDTGRVEGVQGPGRTHDPAAAPVHRHWRAARAGRGVEAVGVALLGAGGRRPRPRSQLRRGAGRRLAARGRPVAARRLARRNTLRPSRRRHL